MRFIPFVLVLLFCCLARNAQSQCEALIVEDKVIDGTHVLRTINQTLVVRGNYTYSMELRSNRKGITAKLYSKAGVEIFINSLEDRLGDVIFNIFSNNKLKESIEAWNGRDKISELCMIFSSSMIFMLLKSDL